MDLNIAALIISFLSFIVAVPAFLIWLNSRTPTIYLVIDKTIKLFNKIENIDGLSILFQNEPISKDLYIMTAYICYIGSQDIEKKDIIKTISLELPKRTRIYNCNIISHTDGLDISKEAIKNKINFNFDLLKNEELFYFETLLELSDLEENIDLKVSSRISGLNSHKTINYHIENYRLLRGMNWFLLWGMIWSALLWMSDEKNIHPVSEQLNFYEKTFYYKGKKLDSDSLYNKLNSYNEKIRSKDYKNLPLHSLKHLEELGKSLDVFITETFRADSLLKKYLESKPDWTNIDTYNIFKNESNMVTLNNNYSVKYKNRFYWFDLIFILYTLSGFILMPVQFKKINRYSKIQPAIDLIREFKKNSQIH